MLAEHVHRGTYNDTCTLWHSVQQPPLTERVIIVFNFWGITIVKKTPHYTITNLKNDRKN